MAPILGRLGSFFIYSYTAVFALGLVIGWAIVRQRAGRQAQTSWSNAALVTLIAGWLGARLGFVLLNWGYFAERPSELAQLWQGGLTAYGGLAGGLLGLTLWCWKVKRPFLAYANLFSPAIVLLVTAGWAACWLEGCAFGAETVLGPLSADLPDSFGVYAVRYQVQLLGIGLNLLLLGLLWPQDWWADKSLFPSMLVITNVIHFGLTFLRGDDSPLLFGWRLDTWLALLFAIVGGMLLQYGRQTKSTNQ